MRVRKGVKWVNPLSSLTLFIESGWWEKKRKGGKVLPPFFYGNITASGTGEARAALPYYLNLSPNGRMTWEGYVLLYCTCHTGVPLPG